jgi:diaminohydroxyphosphoribosylaminopyrimidine deaminase / 5-amino-6-(5-phosphoribosylamino)uracil reductase
MVSGLTDTDAGHLERCIELAEHGRRTASPNPVVGARIVSGGRVVAEGWHERPGGPHAEVVALAAAGERARGATAYVSLEPCSHHGRTPPCADALIGAGIMRAVIATLDPSQKVNGSGLRRLRDAGVEVALADGDLELRARRQNAGFRALETLGRPHITYKAAVSADGRTAPASGERTWISSPPSRAMVHEVRATMDAVAVGVGTVLADDPLLTARDCDPPAARQPLRIVFDRHGRLPQASALVASATPDAPVAQVCRAESPASPPGVERIEAESVAEALQELGRQRIAWLLLEGGATLATGFLDEGVIDRLMLFSSPVELGVGPGLFTRAVRLPDPVESSPIGPDMLTIRELREV